MIQMKIFNVLELVKKTDTLKESHVAESVQKLITEVQKDPNSIIDAYVALDFISAVAQQAKEVITNQTINHVVAGGDDESLGVQLVVKTEKAPDYNQDKD